MTTPVFRPATPATGPGARSSPPVQVHELLGRDDERIVVEGRLLGEGSSHRDRHTHPDAEHAHPGVRCPGCRWFEVRIFAVTRDLSGEAPVPPRGDYLVLTCGRTEVPGETERRRAFWTSSPYEVVEMLSQRDGRETFLPLTSARVLSQTAAWDPGLRDAYVTRRAA